MKESARLFVWLPAVLLLLVAGCATSRGTVNLRQPAPVTPSQPNGKAVFVRLVHDNREFQDNPKTQDTPSLGFGGSSAASADLKKRAIGRKRNTFGKALGDILLEQDETVESVISDTLKRSFSERGYAVLKNEQEVTSDTLVVDASIKKFWAYMTPGFSAITITCDISTTLEIGRAKSSKKESKEITVKSEGKYQTGAEGNWMEVLHQALDKYAEEVRHLPDDASTKNVSGTDTKTSPKSRAVQGANLRMIRVAVVSENLRKTPNGQIIGKAKKGASYEVTDEKGPWLRVRLEDDKEAWIWKASTEEIAKPSP